MHDNDRKAVKVYAHIKDNAKLATVAKLFGNNSTFNPFGTKETTKFIVLDVKASNISLEIMHKYLKYDNHVLSTKQDSEDHRSYTLLLPLNEEITRQEYMYISNSIATKLMLKPIQGSTDSHTVYNGYKDATLINNISEDLKLFDISEMKANFASKKPYPVLKGKEDLTKSQQVKKAEKAMDEYENMLVSLENTDNMLLSFAHIVRYMKIEFVKEQDLLDRVDNINSSLPTPIDEVKKYKYLIEPFKDL